jgi:hypothetical protein
MPKLVQRRRFTLGQRGEPGSGPPVVPAGRPRHAVLDLQETPPTADQRLANVPVAVPADDISRKFEEVAGGLKSGAA